jgi:7-keto-8-aminopelargonate synthetase-like enzyme
VEVENIPRDRLVQNVTLSKAFGVYGGAILCSRELRSKFAASRMFVGSTPLPLPLAFAARQALEIIRLDRRLRQRLEINTSFVKSAWRKAGFDLPEAPGPIVPLYFDDARLIGRVKQALLAAGILPPLIRYPNSPANGYFRFVISSEHTRNQLRTLVETLTPFAAATR